MITAGLTHGFSSNMSSQLLKKHVGKICDLALSAL